MENCGSPYFDKDTTNILKGIALIMMFLHHFFTFPEWWTDGISYPSIEKLIPYFRSPLKLCVPVFCFLTGYLYFFGKNKSFKYSFKKITDILIAYWSVFFIFAIIAAVLVDYKYTPTNFVKECFALYRPTMYFCWYVMFYIPLMALLPLIKKFMLKNIHIDLIITFLLIPLTLKYIERCVHNDIIGHLLSYFEEWLPIVLTGCIFAGYDLFEKTYNLNTKITKNKALNITLYLLLAFASPMGRWAEPEIALSFDRLPDFKINTDALYTPVFIYAVVNLCKLIDFKAVKFIFKKLGKYSLPMWFVSCIFFGNCKSVFQPLLYYPHNPVLVTVWGLILCFIPAYILSFGIKAIQNLKNKIFGLNRYLK